MAALVRSGRLDLRQFAVTTFPLEEANAAVAHAVTLALVIMTCSQGLWRMALVGYEPRGFETDIGALLLASGL